MEFRILGPLEVHDGERLIDIPRRKHRVLLAALLLRAGETVPTDTLIEQLWGERPPRTAKDALVNYVSLLRKALGPELLLTRDPGYVLNVSPQQTDLGRFERLTADARATLSAAERAEMLRQALALWRGSPFSDLAFESFAQLEINRLEDLRLAVRQDLIDAELEQGHHAVLLPELEVLIQQHPFDERLRGQQILALYRSGRQADALDAYQTTRRLLDDELGLEPGSELRELEQAILRQDPDLAAATAAPVKAQPSRRTVTILFADLVDSTALAERLDPEALQEVLTRYFDVMREAVERHGGIVEKFIGDAVMAVFGVPKAHEDDALRAVRAAVDIHDALLGLDRGLQARIGVNTGEIVTGRETALVTGAAVNLAKRLEQAAPAGETLVGAATLRLVRDAVQAEPVEPLRLGHAEPVLAFRIAEVKAGVPGIARRLDLPLIGRERELAQLGNVWGQVQDERRCRVITVLGEAGIGKTRLAHELVSSVGSDATAITGRCVSYGEGATYLPLAEMIDGLSALISNTTSTDEIALAVRRRFEEIASDRPLLLVFEDIHWAEPTLLDLIAYLGERAEGPILCLCLARPELFGGERSPHEATVVSLEPLPDQETQSLVGLLGEDLTVDVCTRIVEIAEGNPLFAEQLVAYAKEEADSLEAVPSSIEALLASRLDRLDPDERALLGRGAVVGREFSGQALAALGGIDALPPLRQAGLLHGSGDSLRFHHVLIRDVAYANIPKLQRAELHERYAHWLAEHDESGVEFGELIGYHLEQAAHYKHELGLADVDLAERASESLAVAGRRAHWRGDNQAAAGLLERALELTRPSRLDIDLELDLAIALPDAQRSAEVAEAAAERARESGDQIAEATARVVAAERRLVATEHSVDELEALAESALPLVQKVGDHAGLVHVLSALRMVAAVRGHFGKAEQASEQIMIHSRLVGQLRGAYGLANALLAGPKPAHEALRTLESLREMSDDPAIQLARAWLLAMLGQFNEAWTIASQASEQLRELSRSYGGEHELAGIAELAGDHEAAARYLRWFCDYLESLGELAHLSTHAPQLGRLLYYLGRHNEAEPLAQRGRELGDEHDVLTQILWRQVYALVLAGRGEDNQAESLAREAIAIAEHTDALNTQGDALCDLAEVLVIAGRRKESATELEKALALYEQKGNLVMAARTRTRLAELSPQPTA